MKIFELCVNYDENTMIQFLLDCSFIPMVIAAAQQDAQILIMLFKVTSESKGMLFNSPPSRIEVAKFLPKIFKAVLLDSDLIHPTLAPC